MDHHTASNALQMERYLLGEMAEPERSAFEEHYFSCANCAEEIVLATKFLDNARQPVLRLEAKEAPNEKPVRSPKPNWWDRWLALAPKPALAGLCACLAMVLVWQNTRPSGDAEVMGSYFVTATRAAGGAPRRIQVLPGQRRIALLFNHTDTSVTLFSFVLENADGHIVQQFSGKAAQDTNDIQVLIPVNGLRAGNYTLRVQNASSHADVAALPFELTVP